MRIKKIYEHIIKHAAKNINRQKYRMILGTMKKTRILEDQSSSDLNLISPIIDSQPTPQGEYEQKDRNCAHDSINQVKTSEKWHETNTRSLLPAVQKRLACCSVLQPCVNQFNLSCSLFGFPQLQRAMIFEIPLLSQMEHIESFIKN